MDIVYSIDDHFIPQAAALTASILEKMDAPGAGTAAGRFSDAAGGAASGTLKTPGVPGKVSSVPCLRFHILSNGISEENQEKFRSFLREFQREGGHLSEPEVLFYDLGDFEGRLARLLGARPETGRFVKAALGRIFAGEYLPEDVHRFLYLDADMIARKDIRRLWELTLNPEAERKNYILAACAEPTIYENLTVKQTPEKTDHAGTSYYNTGLLLVDLDAWRKEEITKKCLAWYAEHNGKFDFADQDIINHVLAGRILPLSQRWNFQTNYHYQSWKSLVARAPWFGNLITQEDYEASRKDPVIVHYAGDERPWIRGNRNPYKKEFETALSRTPWADMPPVEGKENYMHFYHMINVLSEKIPGFRSLVSRVYYQTKVRKR